MSGVPVIAHHWRCWPTGRAAKRSQLSDDRVCRVGVGPHRDSEHFRSVKHEIVHPVNCARKDGGLLHQADRQLDSGHGLRSFAYVGLARDQDRNITLWAAGCGAGRLRHPGQTPVI